MCVDAPATSRNKFAPSCQPMEFGERMVIARAAAKAKRLASGIVLVKKKRKKKPIAAGGVTVNDIAAPGEAAAKFESTRARDFQIAYNMKKKVALYSLTSPVKL